MMPALIGGAGRPMPRTRQSALRAISLGGALSQQLVAALGFRRLPNRLRRLPEQTSPTYRIGHQTTADQGASRPCIYETATGFSPQPLICRNRNFSAEPQSFLSCKKAILASASPNPADAEPVAGWPMAARSAVASQRWCGRTPEPTQCCQRPEIADAIPRPPRVRRAARTRRGLLQLVPR